MKKYICEQCGKEIFDSHTRRFCSKKCCGLSFTKLTEKICLNCKKVFRKNGNRKYCSMKCYFEYWRSHSRCVPLTCLVCKKTILFRPSDITKNKKFCSRQCLAKWKRSKTDHWHDDEVKRQTQVFESQNYKCIPTGLVSFPIPDIIAIKNEKIYAIEIQKEYAHTEKYEAEIAKYFDDIHWIIFQEKIIIKYLKQKN